MTVRSAPPLYLQVLIWAAGNTTAGAVTGLAVGVFRGGGLESTILLVSIAFANVVGFTVFGCSVALYPRLRRLPPMLRFGLLALALLSGATAGTILALYLFPLFLLADPKQAFAIAAINSVLALLVGSVAYAYEGMRWRLAESLREVEEVRLVEARLQAQAARAELSALQARINPHFFFNTLNTISSLVGRDPELAEEIVLTLAELFRYTFKAAGSGPVSLGEELAFVDRYLTIEKARFGDRLRVAWEVDAAARAALVPGLMLQPLVENAVVHGTAPLPHGGRILIRAAARDGRLSVEVEDDGAGLRNGSAGAVREGHALANVSRRLETLYGSDAHFTLEPGPGGKGARARIDMPMSVRGAATGIEAGSVQ